jgi:hypothetical protein
MTNMMPAPKENQNHSEYYRRYFRTVKECLHNQIEGMDYSFDTIDKFLEELDPISDELAESIGLFDIDYCVPGQLNRTVNSISNFDELLNDISNELLHREYYFRNPPNDDIDSV